MENQLQVEYMDINELKPLIGNPREHTDRNINDITKSIKRFGWTNPIIVRKADNMIVAGHGRVEAAKNQGLEQVPVVYVDMSENDAKLYNITDNRTAETSEWDHAQLNTLIEELNGLPDIDIEDTGFYTHELEMMMNGEDEPEIDYNEMWQGMPEFVQDDLTPYKSILVHFADEKHVNAFAQLIGQTLTEKTKYVWHPKAEKANFTEEAYVSEI